MDFENAKLLEPLFLVTKAHKGHRTSYIIRPRKKQWNLLPPGVNYIHIRMEQCVVLECERTKI
jgi:hypothetical protein